METQFDAAWDHLRKFVQANLDSVSHKTLFTTNVNSATIWAGYLAALSVGVRRDHDCRACRHFLERYAGLVTVNSDGTLRPALWHSEGDRQTPRLYTKMIERMRTLTAFADITGPLVTPNGQLGLTRTGSWTHLCGTAQPYERANVADDYKNVLYALSTFPETIAAEAVRLFQTGQLDRSERFIAPAQWFANLRIFPAAGKSDHKNLIWNAVANAPEGYCHVSSSVIGALMTDIIAKVPFEQLRRRHNERVSGLNYQRPKAAPDVGNITTAEKLIKTLGMERSLERRFARLEDLPLVWHPQLYDRPAVMTGTGVFRHLQPTARLVSTVPINITWSRFQKQVLPHAKRIEQNVPTRGAFIGLTDAVHQDAPCLFKWGTHQAWYVYHGGSNCTQWNLAAGWTRVTGIAKLPPTDSMPHIAEGVILLLDGAVDNANSSLGLFPECMISDLHPVRATIEAHSRSQKLQGKAWASACGYDIRANSSINAHVRVTDSSNKFIEYIIDRWD